MFEQAVLAERRPAGRYWAVAIGFGGELLLVTCVLVAPLIWPQSLPRPNLLTWLSLPERPPAAVKTAPPAQARPVLRAWQMMANHLIQPAVIPDKAAMIEDPPAAPGVEGGASGADLSSLAISVLNQAVHVAPPARAAEPKASQPVKAATADPIRIRIGGSVQMGRLVQRVGPIYPPVARQMRISGAVELTGVIGVDGHIRELQIVHGHPLLARAALDAVRQWVYEPTLLDGEPVEVIAPITVNFRLN